jgi:cobalamin biosynthesis protein CobD/CbiB
MNTMLKRWSRSPYFGLVMTGLIASIALLIEARLPVAQEIHYMLQFVWVAVVAAALLAFAVVPSFAQAYAEQVRRIDAAREQASVSEWYDADREWLQNHPDSSVPKQE